MERGELLLPSLAPSEIGAVERVSSTEKERSLPRSPGDGRIGGGCSRNPQGKGYKRRAQEDRWSTLRLKGKSSGWCKGNLGTLSLNIRACLCPRGVRPPPPL